MLRSQPVGPVPADTARVARAAFRRGNPWLRLRDDLGLFYTDERFAALFPTHGQPAEAPWRLALVLVLQFAENLTDRQAADAVRGRIDVKYLLGLELADEGFDFSILSEFRSRIVAGGVEHLLLDALLEHCVARHLLKPRGRQRTDATHVLTAARPLYRLECVGEAMRHALNTLAVIAPSWLQAHVPPEWVDRYGHRLDSARLPSGKESRRAWACQVGADGYHLLDAVYAPDAPPTLRAVEAVAVLRRIWVQQFMRDETRVTWREEADLPPAAQRINSPYDPDARYGTKGDRTWIGYKAHLTETCDEERPHLVTQVETTSATGTDYDALPRVQDELERRALLPAEQFADAGYVAAGNLVLSQRRGIDLVGPVPADSHWQARAGQGFAAEQFAVDWEAKRVTCPRGETSVRWQEASDADHQPVIRVRFDHQACAACPSRSLCTRSTRHPRQLLLRPQERRDALHAARERQRTDEFKVRYTVRAGIEGTISQGVRTCDLRRARYIGQARVHLQHVLTAVALNVVRLANWFAGHPRIRTKPTPFVALFLAAA